MTHARVSVLSVLFFELLSIPASGQTTPYVGIHVAEHSSLAGRGVVVAGVAEESPARRASLSAGDVIVRVGEAPTRNAEELRSAVLAHKIGDSVAVVYLRDGEEGQSTLELSGAPATTSEIPSVTFPDPVLRERVEESFLKAEKAFLTRDASRLPQRSLEAEAISTLFLTVGLGGLSEADLETVTAEVKARRERTRWYLELFRAGVFAQINRHPGTTGAPLTIEERGRAYIAQLGDPDFEKREAATKALLALGEKIRPLVEEAANSEDVEVQWRARMILEGLTPVVPGERPPATYLPVFLEVTGMEGGGLVVAKKVGDLPAGEGPFSATLVRDGKDQGTVWIRDLAEGHCTLHRQTEDDPIPQVHDHLLWFFKLEGTP